MKKNSALWRAVALPAVVLIGLGGGALTAAPAFAATSAPVDAAIAEPAATASPSATTAPSATASPSATTAPTAPTAPSSAVPDPATGGAPATGSTSAKPSAAPTKVAAAPTTLTVVTPKPQDPDADESTPVALDSRTFAIEGTAPIGSRLRVDDDWTGDTIAKFTTTTADFSIPITIADGSPFEQSLDVYGTTAKGRSLDDVFLELEFPAETSAAPTLTTPGSTTFTVAPLPLGFSTGGSPIELSGRGTPGEYVEFFFTAQGTAPDTKSDPDDIYGGSSDEGGQADVIQVDDDGNWTGYAYLGYGKSSVWAGQQGFAGDDGFGNATTHLSPLAGPVDLTMQAPAGTVMPPTITEPSYSDEFGDSDSGFTASAGDSVAIGQDATGPDTAESTVNAPAALFANLPGTAGLGADAGAAAGSASSDDAASPATPAMKSFAAIAGEDEGDDAGDDAGEDEGDDKGDGVGIDDESVDQQIAEDGIQVKGTPSTSQHGYLTTTVSGTGTPGDGIVLYAEDGDTAASYVQALYPELFAELQDESAFDSDVPPTLTTSTTTSLLPKNTGAITVGQSGTWSTTVTLKPGSYGIMAFAVEPAASATPTYSASSELIGVHLTGTPIVDPASSTGAPTELAYTGSQGSVALGLGAAIAALAAGAGLLVLSRRRRRALR